MAKPFVPHPGVQIASETCDAARHDSGVEESKRGDARAYRGIEVRLGPSPIGRKKSIGAIVGNGYGQHATRAKRVGDVGEWWAARVIELGDFWEVVRGEPEAADFGRIDGDHHQACGHSSQLGEPAPPVRPMMTGEDRQRGVEGPEAERERLRNTADDRDASR